MGEELKPCPFCGAVMQKYALTDHYEDFVYCNNCGAQGPNDVSRAEAARMWNLRRPEDALRAELQQARQQLEIITRMRSEKGGGAIERR